MRASKAVLLHVASSAAARRWLAATGPVVLLTLAGCASSDAASASEETSVAPGETGLPADAALAGLPDRSADQGTRSSPPVDGRAERGAADVAVDAGVASGGMTVPRYGLFELTFPVTTTYSNPFDPAVVDVELTVTHAGGTTHTVPGFYFQDYTRSGGAGGETLTAKGPPEWKVRFAPELTGTWSYAVTLKNGTTGATTSLGSGWFDVVPSASHGFVRRSGLHLQLDDGTFFVPLGINAPWFQSKSPGGTEGSWGDGTYGFDVMLAQLVKYQANLFHLWTCNWSAGASAPWAEPNLSCGSTTMDLRSAWEIDYMVAKSQAAGVYLLPILHVGSRFGDAYGPADAITARYATARWGYSTAIMAWEYCKEGCLSSTGITGIHTWASYMKSIDPYQHLRTDSTYDHYENLTSGDATTFQGIFGDANLDIVQPHDYSYECNDPEDNDTALWIMNLVFPGNTVPGAPSSPFPVRTDLRGFGKPFFVGEAGVHLCGMDGTRSGYYASDTTGLIMHGDIWGMLLASSGAYTPWYYQFDPAGAWSNLSVFVGAAGFVAQLPPGGIPDDATPFTTTPPAGGVTATAGLTAIGRKDAHLAVARIENVNGTWSATLRDRATDTPEGGSVTLTGLAAGAYTATWIDTTSGTVVASTPVTATGSGLTLTLPAPIARDVAVVVR